MVWSCHCVGGLSTQRGGMSGADVRAIERFPELIATTRVDRTLSSREFVLRRARVEKRVRKILRQRRKHIPHERRPRLVMRRDESNESIDPSRSTQHHVRVRHRPVRMHSTPRPSERRRRDVLERASRARARVRRPRRLGARPRVVRRRQPKYHGDRASERRARGGVSRARVV